MKKNATILTSLFLILVVTVIITLWGEKSAEVIEQKASRDTASEATAVYVSTSTIPVSVSGMVVAKDEMVVRAQVAGELTSLVAREGQRVTAGEVLARQSVPVREAEITLAQARGDLSALEQSLATEQAQLSQGQAEAIAYSAQQIAELRSDAGLARTEEAELATLTSVESALLTAVSASDFVNSNRTLFTREGLDAYDQVLADLYGNVPNYFQRFFLPSRTNSENLLEIFTEFRDSDDVSVVELQNLASSVATQLETISTLFATAERDVFDQEDRTEELASAYIAERQAVIQEISGLQNAMAQLQLSIDSALQDIENQQLNVIVTADDLEVARVQARYAELINNQSTVVTSATEGVAAASVSLGVMNAPFAGVITEVMVERGAVVMPGEPVMRMVGDTMREVEVVVPASLVSQLREGNEFMVDGEIVGFVDRFSPYAVGGGALVVVSIMNDEYQIGETITGQIILSPDSELYRVPRSYVHFDNDGAFVQYQDEGRSRASIVYDAGDYYIIEVQTVSQLPLVQLNNVSL
jgi:multidrug efflux pump subunit AcrA (membrane-fusion protein)